MIDISTTLIARNDKKLQDNYNFYVADMISNGCPRGVSKRVHSCSQLVVNETLLAIKNYNSVTPCGLHVDCNRDCMKHPVDYIITSTGIAKNTLLTT